MLRLAAAALLALVLGQIASPAAALEPREGWVVRPTQKSYNDLILAVKAAAKAERMAVVTQAGPTAAAASRGIRIPGNRVIGVFNNDFAVRVLRLSVAAMIEAPMRFYLTEDENGLATLSYKKPSAILAPYLDEGGEELAAIAAELDERFAAIAARIPER